MKLSKYYSFSIILFVLLTLNSCGKETVECKIPIAFQTIDLIDYPNITVVDEKQEDQFLVINTQSDFEKFIKLGEGKSFDIDFNAYTLLIGKKVTGLTRAKLLEQNVYFNCASTQITYKVSADCKEGYTAFDNFIFGVLVPKTNVSVVFSVDVQY